MADQRHVGKSVVPDPLSNRCYPLFNIRIVLWGCVGKSGHLQGIASVVFSVPFDCFTPNLTRTGKPGYQHHRFPSISEDIYLKRIGGGLRFHNSDASDSEKKY